jgi:hypothetical protein
MSETFDCGHGCKITCPDGGGCIYWQDTGHCDTFCNDDAGALQYQGKQQPRKLSKNESQSVKVDFSFRDVSGPQLLALLRNVGLIS